MATSSSNSSTKKQKSNKNQTQSSLHSFFSTAATTSTSNNGASIQKVNKVLTTTVSNSNQNTTNKTRKDSVANRSKTAETSTEINCENGKEQLNKFGSSDKQSLANNEHKSTLSVGTITADDQRTLLRRKRRIIEDSDDDDDEGNDRLNKNEIVVDTSKSAANDDDLGETTTTNNDEDEEGKTVVTPVSETENDKVRRPEKIAKGSDSKTNESIATTTPKTTQRKIAPVPAETKNHVNDSYGDKDIETKEKRSVSSILKASGKDQFKSDDDILNSIPATWSDDMMPYSVLCNAFSRIEEITGRLQIQEIMTNLFRQVLLKAPKEMYTVLYLSSNSVAPAYECVELGIGDAILIKAIGEATGTNPSIVKQKYESDGDLGTVAKTFKSKQSTLGGFFKTTSTSNAAKSKMNKYLSVSDVLSTFRKIANTKGSQSQKLKVDSIKYLLVKASDPEETKYIIRGLQGKLRIGLAQSTVLISLAHALSLTIPSSVQRSNARMTNTAEGEEDDWIYPPEAKQYMDKSQTVEKRLEGAVAIVKKAYSEVPSYDAILDAALKVPLELLHKACTLTPGIPVAPMLAKPTKSVQEVLKRLNGLKFTVEYKYDGERAQIHMLPNGTTKVFSRNLLDTSEKYPEVPIFVKEAAKAATEAAAAAVSADGNSDVPAVAVESFVLDTEVVAFNNKTGQLVPFQILSTRKKTEESAETAKVQVIVQAFDLMYLNGVSLLSKTLLERRSLLHKHFLPIDGKFQFAKSLDHEENGDTIIIEEFLDSAVKGQCEGLMVKTLVDNAIYEPSRRSLNWLKLKKDYLDGLGDSVDLVPLGAYHGRGKRTGVYGAYLLACYDPDTEEYQSVCKIGTGFSDEDLQTLADDLNKHKIPTKSSQYNVSDQLECDVWFDTVHVWEVKAADLSKSSAHRGAIHKTNESGRGIGLRFPRFERIRTDKKPDEATTADQILEMYYEQDTIINTNKNSTGGGDNEDDNDDDDGI